MDSFSGKWDIKILWIVHQNKVIGFNKLKREANGITNIVLARTLTKLIENKYIKKDLVGNTAPFKSEYSTLPNGEKLLSKLEALHLFGKEVYNLH